MPKAHYAQGADAWDVKVQGNANLSTVLGATLAQEAVPGNQEQSRARNQDEEHGNRRKN
jgi:hypothetical protein